MKKSNFKNLMKYEIEKNFNFLLVLALLIAVILGGYLIWHFNVLMDSQDPFATIEHADNNIAVLGNEGIKMGFRFGSILAYLILILATGVVLIREWEGKSITAYSILTLPVARWKILLSKFTVAIGFYLFSYALRLVVIFIAVKAYINQIQTDYLKEYFVYKLHIGSHILNGQYALKAIFAAICLISFIFLIICSFKSYGVLGFILASIFCGIFGIYTLVSLSFLGIVFDIQLGITPLLIGGAISLCTSFVLFKNKVSI